MVDRIFNKCLNFLMIPNSLFIECDPVAFKLPTSQLLPVH